MSNWICDALDEWGPFDDWAWDDENTASPPYIHIYGDNGAIACLYYESEAERENLSDFAHFVCKAVKHIGP